MIRASVIRRVTAWTSTFVMASFGFTGIASAQTITNTGPHSTNTISSSSTNTCTVTNTNNISAYNTNNQSAFSGNATNTDNTGDGTSWNGWSTLSPEAAQADGLSYTAWNSTITAWIAHHSTGSSWVSANDNLSWVPSGQSWNAWDPMDWQANGQSFDNWYSGVESYLDSNSSAWLLGWPAEANSDGSGRSAVSGNASNHNSSNFTININNAARSAAGTNSCGQSNFTPPTGGGKGAGGVWTPTPTIAAPTIRQASSGMGSGSGSGDYNSYSAPRSNNAPAVAEPSQQMASQPVYTVPTAPQQTPTAPSMPTPGNSASISNTGPHSTNTISSSSTNTTTVANTNNICVTNISTQTSSSGNASTSDNTTAGGAESGAAANGNATGFGAGISS